MQFTLPRRFSINLALPPFPHLPLASYSASALPFPFSILFALLPLSLDINGVCRVSCGLATNFRLFFVGPSLARSRLFRVSCCPSPTPSTFSLFKQTAEIENCVYVKAGKATTNGNWLCPTARPLPSSHSLSLYDLLSTAGQHQHSAPALASSSAPCSACCLSSIFRQSAAKYTSELAAISPPSPLSTLWSLLSGKSPVELHSTMHASSYPRVTHTQLRE